MKLPANPCDHHSFPKAWRCAIWFILDWPWMLLRLIWGFLKGLLPAIAIPFMSAWDAVQFFPWQLWRGRWCTVFHRKHGRWSDKVQREDSRWWNCHCGKCGKTWIVPNPAFKEEE